MILRKHQRVIRKALLYDGLREEAAGLMTISSSTILQPATVSAFLFWFVFLKTRATTQTRDRETTMEV